MFKALLLMLGLIGLAGASAAEAKSKAKPHVLIFTYSTGYRHASIEPGAAALKALGEKAGYVVTESADPDVFSTDRLKDIDAIVFLSNTTKPTDPSTEWFTGARGEALQAFVHRGGGIVGIHAAGDSHYNWPWYGKLIGGRFTRHPQGTPEGTLHIVDPAHAATNGLTDGQKRVDEWYYYDDYNPEMHLLVTLDPQSIGEKDVNPNPMSWTHEFEGARVFYTGLGHTVESYSDPWFLQHVAGGLKWVLHR